MTNRDKNYCRIIIITLYLVINDDTLWKNYYFYRHNNRKTLLSQLIQLNVLKRPQDRPTEALHL